MGDLLVGDIGLPAGFAEAIQREMLTDGLVREALPARPLESNKGTYGKVMVLAGSPYLAPATEAGTAAGRIGAGLITIAVWT